MTLLTDWWQSNIDALAQLRPAIYEQIHRHHPIPVGRLIITSSGFTNLIYEMDQPSSHTAYHCDTPWQDAEAHLEIVPPDSHGLVVFVGIGLGYGPLLLLNQRPSIPRIVLLEPSLDLFCAALRALDLRPLISSDKVEFFLGEVDMTMFEESVARIAALEDTHILRHAPSFTWNNALYGALNDRAYMLLNQLNAGGGTTRKCGRMFFHNRYENLALLRHSHNLDLLKGLCEKRPAVLVAAGPSLDQSLPDLKACQGKCVLIAADSALAPLLKAGITPDFVTSIDFLDLNFEKLTPFLNQEWPFSLVTMIKATPLVPKRFPARHLFLAFSEDRPHDWIVETLNIKTLAPSCSSVAHLSLGLALILGADPILFVGQDLGFTTLCGDHASGTIIMRQDLPQDREIFHAPAINGGTVPTDRQLLSLKKHFEDIIASTPRHYLNASAAGVVIDGAPAILLDKAIHHYMQQEMFTVTSLVDKAIDTTPAVPVASFIRRCRSSIKHIDVLRKTLAKTIGLAHQAKGHVADLLKQSRSIPSFDSLPQTLARQLSNFDALNRSLDQQEPFWIQLLELNFEILSENDRWQQKNQKIREQEGYLNWLSVELDRIDSVNQCRNESTATYRQTLFHLITHLHQETTLLERKPPGRERDLTLIRLYVHTGDLMTARRLLPSLLAAHSSDAEAMLLAGEIMAGTLNIPMANQHWATAIELKPELASRVTALRQRYADEWLGAADRYANANEGGDNFPHLLPIWLGRADALMAEGQQLPALTALWKKHATCLEEWLKAEKWQTGELILQGWQVIAHRLPAIHYHRAKYAAARNDHQAALDMIETALSLDQNKAQWQAMAARQLLALGRFNEGISHLQKAVSIDRSTADLWEEIGENLARSGDFNGAIMAFERCFIALPDHIDVLRKMGDCYLNLHQPSAAIAAYEAALAKEPTHNASLVGLANAKK
ncbi:MAG: DUF115 domain-containing protein [Proteobacteria bacterium]|nr:DUF115 domain-containing protein [Pseudomonadota bacterium]